MDALFRRLRADGFSELRGARAELHLPVPARLLDEAVAAALPASAPVRNVAFAPHAGNRVGIRFKVAAAPFLPPINVTVAIEEQPRLPASPELVLRLETSGLLSMAGSALRFLDALPPGIRVVGERIHVNIATLLAARGLGDLLTVIDTLEIGTIEGAVVLSARASVPPA